MRAITTLSLFLMATSLPVGVAHAQAPADCSMASAPRALPVQPTVVPALSPELIVPSHQLGAPTGVLAQAYDESQTVDNVLFRLKLEGCRSIANVAPAAAPGVIDPATYKPQTQFDNTPWRFDMNQNGKRMTAEEFDQWMKARGVRVARGAGAAAPAPAGVPGAPVAPGTPVAPAPGAAPGTAPGTAPGATPGIAPGAAAPAAAPGSAPTAPPPATMPTTTTPTIPDTTTSPPPGVPPGTQPTAPPPDSPPGTQPTMPPPGSPPGMLPTPPTTPPATPPR